MNYLGKNIRFLRKQSKLSQSQLGKKINKSESTIQMWETGFRSPTMKSIQKLSEIFDININELVTKNLTSTDESIYTSANVEFIRIPLNESDYCINDRNVTEMVTVPSKGLNPRLQYFAQYANGESMKDAGINDGDLLVFEKCNKVNNGVIGWFLVGEEAMCKKYKELEQIIMLSPMNNNFDPIIVDPLNNNIRCLGKLKKVIKDFNWED